MTRTKLSLYSVWLLAVALAVLAGCSRKPTRTDAEIGGEVQNKISSDSSIQNPQIEVQAANGVVTLTGDVNNDAERALAARDAATVEGVKTVVNNLQVQQAKAVAPVTTASRRLAEAQQGRGCLRPNQMGHVVAIVLRKRGGESRE